MIASQHRREAMLEALGAPAECGQAMSLESELAQLQQGTTKLEKETDPSQLPPPIQFNLGSSQAVDIEKLQAEAEEAARVRDFAKAAQLQQQLEALQSQIQQCS